MQCNAVSRICHASSVFASDSERFRQRSVAGPRNQLCVAEGNRSGYIRPTGRSAGLPSMALFNFGLRAVPFATVCATVRANVASEGFSCFYAARSPHDVTLGTSYASSSLLQVVAVVAWRIDGETVVLSNNSSTWAQRYCCVSTSRVDEMG